MNITRLQFYAIVNLIFTLNLNAIVNDTYRSDAAFFAARNEDKDTAIYIYRTIEDGRTAKGTWSAIAARIPGLGNAPSRWSELKDENGIAKEAVAVYEKHSADLAGPLAASANVTDPAIKRKLDQIAKASAPPRR
jgi:hypothetical protein